MFDIFRLFWCCTCPNCFLPSIIKKEKNKINESTFIFNRFNYLEMLIKLGATKFQLATMLINQTKACIIQVGSRNKFVLASLWIASVTQNRNYLAEIYLSPILTPHLPPLSGQNLMFQLFSTLCYMTPMDFLIIHIFIKCSSEYENELRFPACLSCFSDDLRGVWRLHSLFSLMSQIKQTY